MCEWHCNLNVCLFFLFSLISPICLSFLSHLVPLTELIGDQSRFVKAGSKVALHCIVRGTLDPPQYIIWYRDKTQISDDNKLGWYTQLDRNIFGNNGDNENTVSACNDLFSHAT